MTGRTQMLKKINEISFAVNDLTLYLDTHPTDSAALNAFSKFSKERTNLLNQYAEQFEPLTSDCICPDTNNRSSSNTAYPGQRHFTWIDGPLPWEGGM